jgi:hypothetical protein
MPTHTIVTQWSQSGATPSTSKMTVEAGSETNIVEPIPANSTNKQVAFTADVSQMKSVFMKCDVAVTVKTNSTGSPDKTITLAVGEAIKWTSTDGQSNPLGTVDVTTLYVTNGATAGTFELYTLSDPTV